MNKKEIALLNNLHQYQKGYEPIVIRQANNTISEVKGKTEALSENIDYGFAKGFSLSQIENSNFQFQFQMPKDGYPGWDFRVSLWASGTKLLDEIPIDKVLGGKEIPILMEYNTKFKVEIIGTQINFNQTLPIIGFVPVFSYQRHHLSHINNPSDIIKHIEEHKR